MVTPSLRWNWTLVVRARKLAAGPALVALFGLTIVVSDSALAQSFAVIHNFTGGQDGATPMAGLAIDKAGNFCGTRPMAARWADNAVTAVVEPSSA
jgi:hypothetical protein